MQINVIHMYDNRSFQETRIATIYNLKTVISRPLKVW